MLSAKRFINANGVRFDFMILVEKETTKTQCFIEHENG